MSLRFEKNYFQDIYHKDSFIDGDYNAKDHARYLKSLFELMEIQVSSIMDYGFGKGLLLKELSLKLEAAHIYGLDISQFALDKLEAKKWARDWHLKKSSIHEFQTKKSFDLGVCNSVLQYIKDEDLPKSIKLMASQCRFLYFHVPTSEDYKDLYKRLQFKDPYAVARPLKLYRTMLQKYFVVVSWGLLESKLYKKAESPFSDSFYRFE